MPVGKLNKRWPGPHMSPDKFSTLIFSAKKFATAAGNLKIYQECHGRITCGICHLKINITCVTSPRTSAL